MIEARDFNFKEDRNCVVQVDVAKEDKEPNVSPTEEDIEKYVELVGEQHFNIGELEDTPNKYNPFGLFGVSFGKFLMPEASPKGQSKSVGVKLVDM